MNADSKGLMDAGEGGGGGGGEGRGHALSAYHVSILIRNSSRHGDVFKAFANLV